MSNNFYNFYVFVPQLDNNSGDWGWNFAMKWYWRTGLDIYLVSEDSIGGEICEVTGGVAGVGLHQPVPHPTPGLGLDIPVNTTLKLEIEIFQNSESDM